MASTTDGTLPDYVLSDERRRVRGMASGSHQRQIGAFWLRWLEHIQRCQTEGLTSPTDGCIQHRGKIQVLDNLYPDWDCCELHKALAEERRALSEYAERFNENAAPHQTTEVLTRAWWLRLGHRFVIQRRVVR